MTRISGERVTAEQLERIAAIRARRDRAKMVAAHQEILALRSKVFMLEHSLSRRAGGPARRVIRLLRRLLGRRSDAAAGPASGGRRGLALVIDHHWPEPDRDSGSMDIVNLMAALDRLGFEAILAASEAHHGPQPARDRLAAQGVRCLRPDDAASVADFIRRRGPSIDLCVMCRVYCGGAFLELLQHHAWQARLIFNSIDLNFLREERRARVLQDEAVLAGVAELRDREEHLIRSSDMTFVVSATEQALLAESIPEGLTVQMPLARRICKPVKTFDERRGIGFIGGFGHAPNLDAVRYFLDEIWPRVRSVLPGCAFSIVGPDAPADLAAGAEDVRVVGYLGDVGPWFESLRLTVAPLRFGAGAKGKVASSLAHGVPSIVTSIASEGMSLADEEGVLVRDTPSAFAEALVRAYTNEDRWRTLSFAGLVYAERMLSLEAWEARLEAALGLIGF